MVKIGVEQPFVEVASRIKTVVPDKGFRIWIDSVVKSILSPENSIPQDLLDNLKIICFSDKKLPEKPSDGLHKIISFPTITLRNNLTQVDNLCQIINPVQFLLQSRTSAHLSVLPGFSQFSRYLFVNPLKNINAVDLCIVSQFTLQDDFDKHSFAGTERVSHLIVELIIRIEILNWEDVTYASMNKLMDDLNKLNFNINFCSITNYNPCITHCDGC